VGFGIVLAEVFGLRRATGFGRSLVFRLNCKGVGGFLVKTGFCDAGVYRIGREEVKNAEKGEKAAKSPQ